MSFRTRLTLLGLSLLDVEMGRVEHGEYRRGIARGWISVGDIASGEDRASRRGLWSDPHPVPRWEWRRSRSSHHPVSPWGPGVRGW